MAKLVADERIITDESELTEDELANLKLCQGMLWGALHQASTELKELSPTNVDMEVNPVGTYTGRVLVYKPSGDYLVTVHKLRKE